MIRMLNCFSNARQQVDARSQFDRSDFVRELKKFHEKYFSTTFTYHQFVTNLENKIKNSGNNLETELFDFLGFEHIQYIAYIIEHRRSIAPLLEAQKTTKHRARKF